MDSLRSPSLIVNIDVDDLARAVDFYGRAFGLAVGRRFGDTIVELTGANALIHLLAKPAGTPVGSTTRSYARHWTPIHLDVLVDDLDEALQRALAAGATQEAPVRTHEWGRIVALSDPFGHGFDLIQLLGRGYDEIATG